MVPGNGYTAFNDELKTVAMMIVELEGNGVKTLHQGPGGCSVNTARAANYLLASRNLREKVMTLGCIGGDDVGAKIKTQLDQEGVLHSFHQDNSFRTDLCVVPVVDGLATPIGIMDAKYPSRHMEQTLKTSAAACCLCAYTSAYFMEAQYDATL